MFSIQHFVWLGISAICITFSTLYLVKKQISLDKVLTYCCFVCVVSELIKVFSSVEIVPSTDGLMFFPYLETRHIPLHLCSIQIITIFLAKYTRNKKLKDDILAFFIPTGIIGAVFALVLPTVIGGVVPVSHAFIHPVVYQTFFYHMMLIVLGLYLLITKSVEMTKQRYFITVKAVSVLGILSFYTNSALANATYKNGKLISVDYTTNFFFTFKTPIGIQLTEKWHWILYMIILFCLTVILVGLFFIPALFKKRTNSDS